MKPIFKILVLGAVLILGTTAVVDQGLAADKGSQLIFQSNMAHKSFISIANAHDTRAVTLLTQYYNDEMEMVLWYLRIVLPNGNVLVDPFDHSIPGSDPAVNTGDFIMGTGKAGSGHFVIAVTAVATDAPANADATQSRLKTRTIRRISSSPLSWLRVWAPTATTSTKAATYTQLMDPGLAPLMILMQP